MPRPTFVLFVVTFVTLLGGAVLGTLPVRAMLENALLLRSLGGAARFPSAASAWEDGWRRLCVSSAQPILFLPQTTSARRNALTASLQIGDFPAAAELSRRSTRAGDDERAPAVERLLAGDWQGAVAVQQAGLPSGFSRELWGTVMYLAAQQRPADTRADAARYAQTLYGEDGPLLSVSLATCLDSWGRSKEASDALRRAAPLVTDTREFAQRFDAWTDSPGVTEWHAIGDAQPEYPLSDTSIGQWSLVGFNLDPRELEQAPVLRVSLYWETSRRPAEVALQHATVRNLVANGALAWDEVPDGVRPFGFTASIYHNDFPVSVREQDGRKAVCISRPPGQDGAGLEGLAFPLSRSDGALVIQGADVVSPNGAGFGVARHWQGRGGDAYAYSFLASGPSAPLRWTTNVGSARLPYGANSVRAWIMTTLGDPGSLACFTNLFMFEPPEPPGVGEAAP